MSTLTTNQDAYVEKRLRRYLERNGRGRLSDVYHSICSPGYLVTREQLLQIASRLREENFLELMDGTYAKTLWLVRKDLVEQTMREGALR
jgi:transcriptional regulator of NAD metabolism